MENKFKKLADTYIGYKNEDNNPNSDFGKIKRHYYFEKSSYWQTKLLDFASPYFMRGDKVYFEHNGTSEVLETEELIFRRGGSKFTVQIKEDNRLFVVDSKFGGMSDIKEIEKYKRVRIKDSDVESLYKKSRKQYDCNTELTGYWFVKFDSKKEIDSFCLEIKKQARKNKDILNYFKSKFANLEKEFIVKIYCLDRAKIEIGTIIKNTGVKKPIVYMISKRSALMERQKFTM